MEDNNIKSHSVLLYNTQNIDAQLLKASFSIRKKEYQRIWKDIQTSKMTQPETHYLIQGVRGAGKTTLLSRLSYEVAEDEKLSKWLIPILLNEEEYGILSLFTFWLRITEKLAEHDAKLYLELFQQVLSLDNDAVIAWELIQHYLDENKQKIIVFVDNLGELFKDFDDIEHAQLREVLSFHPHMRLIGGSSQLLEAHFDVSAPFYQFFKLINLKSINETEMHELLRSLAQQTNEEAIKTIEGIITEHPERIEAVRRLTDGVPRTIVSLFQIIMEGAKESSYAYLEETIDKTTPLYKHRMDDLSRQQKAIVHTVAMNWDAMSTKEIAEQTRLPSKTVSAQLVKLQQQWIVDKIETSTKNHLYIIKERFFNIWYLMRYGNQKDKRRVLWLTRFLESWYDKNELNIKLAEIAIPYIDLNGADGFKLRRTKEVYINALLASEHIDETLKAGVNIFLEPYYNNLFQSKEYKSYKSYLKNCFSNIESQKYEEAKLDIEEILKLDIGTTENLIVLEVADHFLNKEEGLKDRIINNIIRKSSKSSTSRLMLLMNIIDMDYTSVKNVGRIIVNETKSEAKFDSPIFMVFQTYIQLWFDEFENFKSSLEMLRSKDFNFEESSMSFYFFENLLILLMKKNQLEIIYELMSSFKHLQEQFKPIYYATVSLLKDERQQEYLRMGSELQGTVDEILQKVEEYRVKYA
ncbi:hypothetical protein [Psychrobacter sp. 72-O-c]|uniref:hypothetical protein n=1 Tax=Psychrobacter sp. 72-O-c TaxID=2774125 RepID=UPI0019186225|nr:hypothetical protein [Psychrobacter sp. 72-O-c]